MPPTPLLDRFYLQGVDVFLYFGKLAAAPRTGGGSLAPEIAAEIRENKEALITEIKLKTAGGEKISLDKIITDRLQSDGTLRPAAY